MKDREYFEKIWPVPKDVKWDDSLQRYMGFNPRKYTGFTKAADYQQIKFNCWNDGWQAAIASKDNYDAEIARLQREVVDRNARAIEGDKAVSVRENHINLIEALSLEIKSLHEKFTWLQNHVDSALTIENIDQAMKGE